jgi:hypothetical protein
MAVPARPTNAANDGDDASHPKSQFVGPVLEGITDHERPKFVLRYALPRFDPVKMVLSPAKVMELNDPPVSGELIAVNETPRFAETNSPPLALERTRVSFREWIPRKFAVEPPMFTKDHFAPALFVIISTPLSPQTKPTDESRNVREYSHSVLGV